jgi:hypothetical protein
MFKYNKYITNSLIITKYINKTYQHKNKYGVFIDLEYYLKVILHQFRVKTIFPWKFIWNTVVSLLSYSCMFQVEICSQQLEICKSVCMFFLTKFIWRRLSMFKYNKYITNSLIITKYINKTYQHKNKCLLLTSRFQKGR